MMDVATIVITASAITLVLQIVVIALIIDTRKKLKNEQAEELPLHLDAPEVKKQRETENRFNRRPPQEQRSRPAPAQPQNVEQVERSLRDINLRLKNAERDQEKERRRIKDTMGPSGPGPRKFDHQKPRDREEGPRRNDRPRHEYHQNRNGDAQRPPREDRGASRSTFEIKESKESLPAPAAAAPVVTQQPPAPPILISNPPSMPQSSPQPVIQAVAPVTEQKENLQHGRKVMVKRRVLNLEEEKAAIRDGVIAESSTPLAAPVSSAENIQEKNPSDSVDKTPENPQESSESSAISFGR